MKINKKYIIFQIIGLVIALIILANSILIPININQQILIEEVEENPSEGIIISVGHDNTIDNQGISFQFKEAIPRIDSQLNQILTNKNFDVNNSTISIEALHRLFIGNDTISDLSVGFEFEQVRVKSWNFDTFKRLRSFNSFNKSLSYNPSQKIIVFPEGVLDDRGVNKSKILDPNLRLLTGFNRSLNTQIQVGDPLDKWRSTINLGMDRIEFLTNDDFNSLIFQARLQVGGSHLAENAYIYLPHGQEVDLFDKVIEAPIPEDFRREFLWPEFRIVANIKHPSLGEDSLRAVGQKLLTASINVKDWIISNVAYGGRSSVNVVSPLMDVIDLIIDETSSMDEMMHAMTISLMSITVFLIYISLSVSETRREEQIRLARRKGLSNNHLIAIFVSELLLSSLLSSMISIILMVPALHWILGTSDAFNIKFENLVVVSNLYWQLPLIAIILAFNFNYLNLRSLGNRSLLREGESLEISSGMFERFHIDVFAVLGLGIIFSGIILIQPSSQSTDSFLRYQLNPLIAGVLMILLPIVIAKNFGVMVKPILRILSRFPNAVSFIGLNHLKVNYRTTSKFIAIATLSVLLVLSSEITFQSYEQWGVDSNYYNLGSDIYVSGIDPSNEELWNVLNTSGVEAFTEIVKYKNIYTTQFGTFNFTFLGINPDTFEAAAYWDTRTSLNGILNKFDSPFAVGLQRSIMTNFERNLGDKLLIRYTSENETLLPINTQFDYFPNLVEERPYEIESGIFDFDIFPVLASYNQTKFFVAHSSTPQGFNPLAEYGAYLKINHNYDIDEVAARLELSLSTNNSISVHTINDRLRSFKANVNTNVFDVIVQTVKTFTFIVLLVNAVLYVMETITIRRKEFAIFQTFGINRSQMFRILTVEMLLIFVWITLISGLGAMLVSYILLDSLIFVLNDKIVPPSQLVTSPGIVLEQFGFILLIIITFIILILNSFCRMKPGEVLRTE